jgi:hypothetical protein
MRHRIAIDGVNSWHWLRVVFGMVSAVFLLYFYTASGAEAAAASGGKPAGKASAEKAAVAKPAEKPPDKPTEKPGTTPIINPQADKLLREMGEYLKNAQQFSFQAEITFDDVLPSGQKIQFGATEDVAVRRPNGAYIEYRGDVGGKRFWYNGETVTLYDPNQNFYAAEKVPPKLDEAVDYIMDQLGFTPPLADLFYSDPYKVLIGKVQFGIYVGSSTVEGQRCHHLAFVDRYVDWQVWIEDGKQLVPRKILITYKTIPGAPQFTAILSDWDFATPLPGVLFNANLPAIVEKIEFVKMAKSLEKKK